MKRLNKLKTLTMKVFETFEDGALRQLNSWEAKQLGYLRKEVSRLVRKNSVMLRLLPKHLKVVAILGL